jgi:hypothetical protein
MPDNPNQQISQLAPGGVIQLEHPPAALDDATFDSLFPSDGVSQVAAPQQPRPVAPQGPAPQPPAPQPAPVQPAAPSQPFIKAERSVYNTPEAAVEGINQKDALIENMRQRYALVTGVDPVTGKPIAPQTAEQAPNYYNQPNKYLDDLYAAARQGGPEAYRDVQAKFMLDTLQPLQPLIQRMAKEQAVEQLSTEIPDVKEYISTPGYRKALEANSQLNEAISIAESDIRFHNRLPELYKTAYWTGKGMQLPDLLRQNQTQQVQTTQVPVRTTLQPTTPALPTQQAAPTFRSMEGIKAIIAEAEGRGVKLDF